MGRSRTLSTGSHRILRAVASWLMVCVAMFPPHVGHGQAPVLKAEDNEMYSDLYALSRGRNREPTVKWLPKPRIDIPEANACNETEMKPYTEPIPDTRVKFEMLPIRGGDFIMGSTADEVGRKSDEGPQHRVHVDAFWMGKYEVTWNEFELWANYHDKQLRYAYRVRETAQNALADAISLPSNTAYFDVTFGMGKEGYPAVCMTQIAAKLYCKWLSAKTGRYYRLPTEAEWEYACRAGTKTAYSFGNDPKLLGEYAWYEGNGEQKYHKVGQKKPNPWGLYDMHGNVAEWVLDQYVPDYARVSNKVSNPFVPTAGLYPRGARGGAWTDEARKLRGAARRSSPKDWSINDPLIPQGIGWHTDASFVGFRLVRPLRLPSVEECTRLEGIANDVEGVRRQIEEAEKAWREKAVNREKSSPTKP